MTSVANSSSEILGHVDVRVRSRRDTQACLVSSSRHGNCIHFLKKLVDFYGHLLIWYMLLDSSIVVSSVLHDISLVFSDSGYLCSVLPQHFCVWYLQFGSDRWRYSQSGYHICKVENSIDIVIAFTVHVYSNGLSLDGMISSIVNPTVFPSWCWRVLSNGFIVVFSEFCGSTSLLAEGQVLGWELRLSYKWYIDIHAPIMTDFATVYH